jgi:putative nucleotidyltransferase with HDIG domain
MAAALVVAIVATAVGVGELSKIIGKWIDGNIRQTMSTVTTRFDSAQQLQAVHAALLVQDERFARAVAQGRRSVPFDPAPVTAFLSSAKPAVAHSDLVVLDQDGVALADTGTLRVSVGESLIPTATLKALAPGATVTTLMRLGGRETMTSLARDSAGTCVLAVVDVIDDAFLGRSFHGLASAFAYFDGDRRFVARYIDSKSLGVGTASSFAERLTGADDPAVAAALVGGGGSFSDVTIDGGRYRMLAQPLQFPIATDPGNGKAFLLAVVSTSVEEQAGAATMRLIAFWSMLAVLMLTGFGLLVARRVSEPLAELSETARRVAEGDFSRKVAGTGGGNEIADLARSFNQMTDSLQQRTESITKKVLELATLYEMSRALGSTLELDVLLDSVLDSALRIFNVESGYIVLRDRDTEQLVLKAWRGMSGGRPDERALRSSMCEWVAREGRPLIYNPPAEGETGGGQIDNVTGATAALCVPLISNEGIIGAVTVGSRDVAFRFTSDDVRLLSTIANHATIAVGNIELFSTLQEAYIATVRALAAAVDAKDPYTRGHSDRVAEYSMDIAEELDLSTEQKTALEMAAYLHDIGKIGIREEILLKPGRLTDEEMAQMRHHPLIGANILKPVAFPWAIAPVVRHHHEHWDGKGYPAGLRGEEIPLLARILSVADSYEAMTSDRPYRPGRSMAEGIAELKRCAGTQFDSRIVDAFVNVLKAEERDRAAVIAHVPADVQPDEARAIFVAVCDGMLASFRRLGGPRLSSNLETELNRYFAMAQLSFTFSGGRLAAKWDPAADRDTEVREMRHCVTALGEGMARTSGASLVDGFYNDALSGLSTRMRVLAETMELYRKP